MAARSPDSSIHRSWTAGPLRASSRSTKCGPSSSHSTLPAWQSPCRRMFETRPACSKHVARLSQHLAHQRLVGGAQVRRYEALLEHECSWFFAEGLHVEHWPVLERTHRSDRVDTADETSHPGERVAILQFWCTPALAGIQRERKPAMLAQRSALADVSRALAVPSASKGPPEGLRCARARQCPERAAAHLGYPRRAAARRPATRPAASSSAKACSSRIAARGQRCGR